MKRAGPALLIAVMLLSACAAGEPGQTHYHANWLAEGPRTVRVLVGAAAVEPLYTVERHNVGRGALGGASAGLLVGGLILGGATGSCDRGCAGHVAAFIGGAAAIGALIGAVGAPGQTVRSLPLNDHDPTRTLAPAMQRAGREINWRVAEMFAENLRRHGHAVSIVEAGDAGANLTDSKISLTVESVELVGPKPGNNIQTSLRITILVRAYWRGSTHSQRFLFRSEAAGLEDWTDSGGAVADQAVRLAVSNLSGRMFKALAEP